jgi:hypothetical protein
MMGPVAYRSGEYNVHYSGASASEWELLESSVTDFPFVARLSTRTDDGHETAARGMESLAVN